jgi:hypothetical protein
VVVDCKTANSKIVKRMQARLSRATLTDARLRKVSGFARKTRDDMSVQLLGGLPAIDAL